MGLTWLQPSWFRYSPYEPIFKLLPLNTHFLPSTHISRPSTSEMMDIMVRRWMKVKRHSRGTSVRVLVCGFCWLACLSILTSYRHLPEKLSDLKICKPIPSSWTAITRPAGGLDWGRRVNSNRPIPQISTRITKRL